MSWELGNGCRLRAPWLSMKKEHATAGGHGLTLPAVSLDGFSRRCLMPARSSIDSHSFLLWSLSFYPQPLLNWRRKSTAGLTVAYPLLNVLGFACYASATGALLFNPTVRHQYAIRFPTAPEPVVEPNDFAFALHGLVLCAITYSQLWPRLWGFEAVPGQQASRLVLGVFFGCINGLFSVSVAVVTDPDTPDAWTSLDIVRRSCTPREASG